MPCFHPQVGYRSSKPNANGKYPIVFNKRELEGAVRGITIPCKNCIGCRLEESRQWAIRATHEAMMYPENCFITLTYAPEHLPKNGVLVKEHAEKFMKDLREKYRYEKGKTGIRSFGCAEYGYKCKTCGKNKIDCYKANKEKYDHEWNPTFGRPHYHLCLFNHDWSDKKLLYSKKGNNYYKSQELEELWGRGITVTTDMTWETAAYVGRYVTKKIKGKGAEKKDELGLTHYEELDPTTGEIIQKPPERSICISRMPGLGKPWFDRYYKDCYPGDQIKLRGKTFRPPKYYDDLYEKLDPEDMKRVKIKRMVDGEKKRKETTLSQLEEKERKQKKSAKKLVRELDGETNEAHLLD